MFRSVAFGNGTFVAIAIVGDSLKWDEALVSTNGIDWTEFPGGDFLAVGYGNGLFVAVGGEEQIYSSPDGITWTQRNSGDPSYLYSVAYGNGQFVVAGSSGAILSSPDGIQWTARRSGAGNDLAGVAHGNGRFITVGDYGTILESGPIVALGLPATFSDGSTQFTLSGPSGQSCLIQASTDLANWMPVTNLVLTNGTSQFHDGPATSLNQRFYRAAVP